MRRGWRRRWRLRIGNTSTTTQNQITTKPGQLPGFVLLIAPSGSYRIAPYLNAALSLGFGFIVASNSKHSLVPEVAKGITVDFSDSSQALAIILSAIKRLNILCVLATDDSCVDLGNLISQHLDLPHNTIAASRLTHRKDLARQALKDAGCNIPAFQIVPIKHAADIGLDIKYPVVLKPLIPQKPSISGISCFNCSEYLSTRQPVSINFLQLPFFLYSRSSSAVLIDSFFASPMKPQVLRIITSASSSGTRL